MQATLVADSEIKIKLMNQFKSQNFGVAVTLSRKDLGSTVVGLAAKRPVGRSLQLRRKYAGFLLNSIKCVKSIQLKSQDDFGKGCDTQTIMSPGPSRERRGPGFHCMHMHWIFVEGGYTCHSQTRERVVTKQPTITIIRGETK